MRYLTATQSVRSTFVFAFVFFILAITSCQKNGGDLLSGQNGAVKVRLVSSEFDTGNDLQKKSATQRQRESSPGLQVVQVPFGDDMVITATLEEVGANVPSSSVRDKKAGIVREDITAPIKYKVLVYDTQTKDLVDEKDYVNGTAGDDFTLVSGTEYTFISYSINSTSALPAVTGNKLKLDEATVVTGSDLMYFRHTQTITSGSNILNIVLKHQYSEINTTLSVGSVWGGKIQSIGTTSFRDDYVTGSINLEDGAITYLGSPSDKSVSFPSVGTGVSTVTNTSPSLVVSPSKTDSRFHISSMTVNGISNSVSLNDLNVQPGKKYNLNLTFNAPCIQEVRPNAPVWRANHSTPFWTTWSDLPAADFGFVFDIHSLDNSFEIEVNGESVFLTSREYQYRSKNFWGTWSAWTTVTSTATTRDATRTIASHVSFPIWWNQTGGDLDFQMSAKYLNQTPGQGSEDYAINNIRFVDPSNSDDLIYGGYGDTGSPIPSLWNAGYWHPGWTPSTIATTPNPHGPLVRVVIKQNGAVEIFGKRVAGGPLVPMEIIPERYSIPFYFNQNTPGTTGRVAVAQGTSNLREERAILRTTINPNISWNSTGTNTVRIRQKIVNVTNMAVDGYGVKRIPCAP